MDKQLSFVINEATEQLFYALAKTFNVRTKEDVLRRALALATIAVCHADENGIVTFLSPDGNPVRVNLRG